MSRLGLVDRLQTIAATVTLTSAVWIVVGTVYLDRGSGDAAGQGAAKPAAAVVASAGAGEPAADDFAIPVRGVSAAALVDTYGDARGGRAHTAIDIMAPEGTEVIAAAPGTIERLFLSEAGGNTVYVRSPDRRTIHYYAHLRAYAPGLAERQHVRRGQTIGTVGSTGNADPAAPHLHFEVLRTQPEAEWWEPASPVNPYPLLASASS